MKPLYLPVSLFVCLSAAAALAVPPADPGPGDEAQKAAAEKVRQYRELERRQSQGVREWSPEQRSRLQQEEADRIRSATERENRERKARSETLKKEKALDSEEAQRTQMKRYAEAQRKTELNQAYAQKLKDLTNEMKAVQEKIAEHGPDRERHKQRYDQLAQEYQRVLAEWQVEHKAAVDAIDAVQKKTGMAPAPSIPEDPLLSYESGFGE